MRLTRARGPLLIGSLALLWGSNFAWIKIALEGFTPAQLTFGRMLLGAFFLCVVIAWQGHDLPRGWAVWGHLAVAALVANALPYLLFAIAEKRINSGTAGVINATTPLWTLALMILLRQRERITTSRIAGFLAGLAGCIILFSPWKTGDFQSTGGLACLGAALSYAVSYIYMARHLAPRPFTPFVLAAAQLIAACGWTLIAVLPDLSSPLPATSRPWLAVAILGVLGTGGAYVVNYVLVRAEGAAGASIVTYLVPVVALIVGAVLLAELPARKEVIGALLVVVGVCFAQRTN